MLSSRRGSGLRWQTQESFTVARLPRYGILKFKDWLLHRAAVTLADVGGRPQRAVALAWSLRGAIFSGRRKIDIETVS